MSRLFQCAIDSRPLSDDIFTTYDYSGLQVHGLTTTPLSSFLGKNRLGGDGLCTLIPIAPGRTWTDGALVTAAQYLEGMRKVLNTNPFVKRFLFRKVKSVQVVGDSLELELHRPNYRLEETLSIPNFCPYRSESGVSSGEFRKVSENQFEGRSGEAIAVQVVKDPERNLELYKAGLLDLTADTAFPYHRFEEFRDSKELGVQEVGLSTSLVFGPGLQSEGTLSIRRFIQQTVEACDFTPVTFGLCRDMRSLLTECSKEVSGPRSLRLACDDFYPNKEICEIIAREFEGRGVSTNLVQDDYYAPKADFDVKLTISRGLGNAPYLRYAGELFGNVLTAMPNYRARYAALLDSLEATEATPQQLALHGELSWILREVVSHIPLFSIPSTYLSKLEGGRNPLLPFIGVA